jgi:hypothetical protein
VDEHISNRKMARRRLLRRAGTVAAGVAGASAVGASLSSPADAAVGDNMKVGQANAGVGNSTTLTNNSGPNPTLVLGNAATGAGSGGLTASGAPLLLTPAADFAAGPVGSLGTSLGGTLWSSVQGDGGPVSDFVRTGGNSTMVRAFSPVRILDTRPNQVGIGKNCMINEDTALDVDGNIKGNFTLQIQLDQLLVWAEAILCNITVVAGPSGGYITAYPGGGATRPTASNVNFSAGQVVANFAMVGLDDFGGFQNVLSIYALFPAKVIIDVCGAIVNYSGDIKPIANPPGFAAPQGRLRQRPVELIGGGPN